MNLTASGQSEQCLLVNALEEVVLLHVPNVGDRQRAESHVVRPPESVEKRAFLCESVDCAQRILRCTDAQSDAVLSEQLRIVVVVRR